MRKPKRKPNPLRADPTRTALLRRAFIRDLRARFEALRREVLAYVNTAFAADLVANAPRFVFATVAAKITAFRRWLTRQVAAKILMSDPTTGEPLGKRPWFYKYTNSAYRAGLVKAYVAGNRASLGKPMPYYAGTKEQFLETSFNVAERTDKLQLLYTRAYENLRGVTAAMSAQMATVLADGVANGVAPAKIARNLARTVSGIERKRARMIARTETIYAHAEGALDGLEDLGFDAVSADVEFSTAGDAGVCPKCRRLNGKIYTTKQARGLIPVHPNCRCTWLPVVRSNVTGNARRFAALGTGPRPGRQPRGNPSAGRGRGPGRHRPVRKRPLRHPRVPSP